MSNTSNTRPIVKLKDVSFSYGQDGARALDHVSLAVNEGEFVGVIGPSGAGKSTLAAVMSGAIPHHYTGQLFGATLVDGRDTCEVTLTDISRVVGSVLQDIDSQMVASVVEDEMLFGLENYGVPHDQIEGRMSRALETVGISDLRDREIATLSGGQKQKVAIAAILALAPRVLVLDEPTAALDPASSTLVFETLRQVNEVAGITVVVIEQKVGCWALSCAAWPLAFCFGWKTWGGKKRWKNTGRCGWGLSGSSCSWAGSFTQPEAGRMLRRWSRPFWAGCLRCRGKAGCI